MSRELGRRTARLADFGLAYVRDATPLSGDQTPGTLLYMAPEQATRGVFSERSDIFSLGAVIFEALTGVQLLGCGQDPVSAAEKLPEGMAQIVGHAIQIDPSRRYASAQWMAEDLEAVLQGEPPRHAPPLAGLAEAGPVPSSRARMTWSQRGGGIGSVIAVAAAIVAIVAAAWPRLGPLAETGRATVSAHTDSRSQSPLVSRVPFAHQTSPQPTARTDSSQVRPYLRHLTTGKELPYGLNLTWNEDLWNRSNEISMGLLSTSLMGSPGVTAAMADCRPKQSAVLFEHEGGSGGVLEVRVPQNLGVLPADVRDKVSEVHLQGHDLWVILYEQEHFQGLGLVVNSGRQAGRVVKLAAVDFNDQPRSIRTINRPRHWHEVLALREFAEDEGRYDLRATTHAEAFADWVRESIALGNARECRWEQLEVDLKQRRITGRLFIRHRHRPGGILGDQHVYSWTQRLVFEVDLQDLDETIPKVTMRLLGKGISIDASEVIQRLLQAGIIPVAGSERLWDWACTLAL